MDIEYSIIIIIDLNWKYKRFITQIKCNVWTWRNLSSRFDWLIDINFSVDIVSVSETIFTFIIAHLSGENGNVSIGHPKIAVILIVKKGKKTNPVTNSKLNDSEMIVQQVFCVVCTSVWCVTKKNQDYYIFSLLWVWVEKRRVDAVSYCFSPMSECISHIWCYYNGAINKHSVYFVKCIQCEHIDHPKCQNWINIFFFLLTTPRKKT